jgi:hypothetical protein
MLTDHLTRMRAPGIHMLPMSDTLAHVAFGYVMCAISFISCVDGISLRN